MMNQHKHWEQFLPLVEFAYNNSYQSAIKMAPFEFLYGRPCQTPLSWDRLEDNGPTGARRDPRNGILNANYKTKDQGSAGLTEELCRCTSCRP
jgi:glycine cleavage system protein P-like pyridoxal-binding family